MLSGLLFLAVIGILLVYPGNAKKVKEFCKKKSKKVYTISKELPSLYKNGELSRMATDFILFKCRLWTSTTLECGILKRHNSAYELIFYDGDRRYRLRFPKNRRIRQITNVTTSSGQNITTDFIELMGPGHNFYNISSTPKLLGWDENLNISYRNMGTVTYSPTEEIQPYLSAQTERLQFK